MKYTYVCFIYVKIKYRSKYLHILENVYIYIYTFKIYLYICVTNISEIVPLSILSGCSLMTDLMKKVESKMAGGVSKKH